MAVAPENSLYELLELDRSASTEQARKAFRRLAVLHHPDKGGDSEHFKKLTQAHEVLTDPDKRRRYDERGLASLDAGAADAADLFAAMFGGGGRSRRRTKDIVHPLSVTLEQLYTGCTKRLAVHRDLVDKDMGISCCGRCGGTGATQMDTASAPVALLPRLAPCVACSGTGKAFKIKKEREVLEVYVPKGAPHGHRITFRGKADEQPDCEPGDVVFVVHQQEHVEFKRRGADLFLAREISLLEALTGFQMRLTHLDGREFYVKTGPGDVVRPLEAEGSGLKAVIGEGMPTIGQPFLYGNLFLALAIRFPDALDAAAEQKLRQALPGPNNRGNDMEAGLQEPCFFLEDLDPLESAGPVKATQQSPAHQPRVPPAAGCPLQ